MTRSNALLEKVIERRVTDHAKRLGMLAYKFTSPNRRSVPDRLFITPHGEAFFIEFKRTGGKPTDGQIREIARLKQQGIVVKIIDNIDDGIKLINNMMVVRFLRYDD